MAPDRSAVLAFPDGEKPIAFFPFEGRRLGWRHQVYPLLAKCWKLDWTGIPGATGRAFLVTRGELRAYVLPVPPKPDRPVEPAGVLRFDEAQRWSRELLLLTSDTIHAASYWDFLSTPTAELRELADSTLLARLKEWSNSLATALARSRPDMKADEADHFLRSLLDQLLFVRFCEDRHVTALGTTLFDFRGGTLRWPALRTLIRQYRRILNGDVFDPDVFDGDAVPAGLLQEALLHLYQDFTFETIPSDMLGRTYEQSLARRLEWDPPRARYVDDDSLRKQYGIYYTPEPIAAYLAQRALDIWRTRATKPIHEVQFLDPCAGSGTFLVQGLRALIDELRKARDASGQGVPIGERARLLEKCVFGLDINPAPLERSALACYFEALSGQGVAHGERLLPRLLGSNLREGDAQNLAASLPRGLRADIILLNPPYTNHRSRSAPCWTILRQAIEHLPENGVLGAILPDAILRNKWLREARKEILSLTAIEEFGLIRIRVFEKPNIRPILLLLRRVKAPHVRMAHVPRSVFIRSVRPNVEPHLIERSANQASFIQPPLYLFNAHVPDSVTELQTRLVDGSRFRTLETLLRCTHGITNPPPDALRRKPEATDDFLAVAKVYLRGRDIKLFNAAWSGWLIDYRKAQEATEGSKDPARHPGLFEAPCKLLVRESGRIVQACLDFDRRYADNGVMICLPNPAFCTPAFLHFILGYLNSEMGWLWYRVVNPQDPAVMPKLKQKELEGLWIPVDVDETEVARIAVLSHRVAQTLASGYLRQDDHLIVSMRQQLLVRLARLLELGEADVNVILDFLDEPHSVCERPFRYPRGVPPVPFVELPDRPVDQQEDGALWENVPLSEDEQRRKNEWEDIINGPLPDIYEHQITEEDLRLGRELKSFAARLERIEALLKDEADG